MFIDVGVVDCDGMVGCCCWYCVVVGAGDVASYVDVVDVDGAGRVASVAVYDAGCFVYGVAVSVVIVGCTCVCE